MINQLPKREGEKQAHGTPFDPTHPLYSTHYQYIKSVQATPVFNIYMPKFPGKPPSPPPKYSPDSDKKLSKKTLLYLQKYKEWEKKADEWACAILIMFQPHPHHYSQDQPFSNETDFSWEAFMNYYNTLRKSNRCIDKMRLRFMLNFSTSLISTNKHRICYGEFRHRASTKWTREEKDEINAMFPNGVDSRPLNCDADEEEVIADYTSYHLNKAKQFHDHCNILKTKLNKVSAMTTPSSQSRLTSFKEKSLAIQKKRNQTLSEHLPIPGLI
jgi:hypothetical protein